MRSRSRSCCASISRTDGCCEGSPYERRRAAPRRSPPPREGGGAGHSVAKPGGASPMTATVMITTGGTGGHVFPGLAVASELKGRGARVFWLGTYAILSACWQARRVLARRQPNVVVGFGGFVSFPGALMAVAQNRPLVIHNLDARPGLANRVLRFGADRVLTGFPGTFGASTGGNPEWVGNPLRAEIAAVPPPEERFAGRSGPLALLVVGGSLGALALNERVPKALALLSPDVRPRVVHQAGEQHI